MHEPPALSFHPQQLLLLPLPDRSILEPSDLKEVDKRKWHKFLVHLAIKDGHANHGGKRLKIDLYRYQNLEDWILEISLTPNRVDCSSILGIAREIGALTKKKIKMPGWAA